MKKPSAGNRKSFRTLPRKARLERKQDYKKKQRNAWDYEQAHLSKQVNIGEIVKESYNRNLRNMRDKKMSALTAEDMIFIDATRAILSKIPVSPARKKIINQLLAQRLRLRNEMIRLNHGEQPNRKQLSLILHGIKAQYKKLMGTWPAKLQKHNWNESIEQFKIMDEMLQVCREAETRRNTVSESDLQWLAQNLGKFDAVIKLRLNGFLGKYKEVIGKEMDQVVFFKTKLDLDGTGMTVERG